MMPRPVIVPLFLTCLRDPTPIERARARTMGQTARRYRRIASGALGAVAMLATAAQPQVPATPQGSPPTQESPTTPGIAESAPRDHEVHQSGFARSVRVASELLATHRTELEAPGVSAAVAIDGKLIWSEAQGYANLEARTPLLRSTPLRIGSTSKALTSAALGILVEAGTLDLDSPIQRYVPTFPEKTHPITARQLASHRAGIRHYDPQTGDYWNRQRYADVTAALGAFANDPLLFPPGSAYHYSTYGYTLLSAAIEGASEQDFLSFMQTAVFAPAGMTHTGAESSDTESSRRLAASASRFYVHSSFTGGIAEPPPVDHSVKWAGGGFFSTSLDLARFGVALLEGDLLAPETFRLLTTPTLLPAGPGAPRAQSVYALGWRSQEQPLPASSRSVRTIHHGGTALGATSFLVLMPDERLVIAVNRNLHAESFGPFSTLALRLAEVFLGEDDDVN